MTSNPRSTTQPRYNLAAGLVLTSRELKQYRQWQSQCTTLKPTECGFVPTAVEYEDFQQWLKKQDSGYFSDVFDDIYEHISPPRSPYEPSVASLCRHNLHPVLAGKPTLRCPVCTIDMHINYMKVLTRTLQGANGRPLPFTGTPSEQQENLYLAWSQGKISILREVCELERLEAQETEWSKTHLPVHTAVIHTATKALELYWFETAECPSMEQCTLKPKAVSFDRDTNFERGRPTAYFLRSSPRYEPGKYTIVGEDCEDDEAISKDSDDYSHARVMVLGGPEEEFQSVDHNHITEAVRSENGIDDLESDDGDAGWEDVNSDEDRRRV
ncbi:hypothetical protein EK21DRAFT_92780 [Setomelanomma holmii]|uniref:Uncharacterized protein n=1 Tax=Setomelanomma holmii TaxID=210430 RepID=A0A9P4H0D9_9PLEO|nr:hypothetical protein EK21DRAFT_92780 [Setomelanomma holmii]